MVYTLHPPEGIFEIILEFDETSLSLIQLGSTTFIENQSEGPEKALKKAGILLNFR